MLQRALALRDYGHAALLRLTGAAAGALLCAHKESE
jgi:hypothetical protein